MLSFSSLKAISALPHAGISSGRSGISTSSSFNFSKLTNADFNSDKKAKGPPQKNTLGRISLPRASELMTWMATALNTDLAMSLRLTLRLARFWISVFEKTPQREAIGYTFSALCASVLSSLVSISNKAAVWSIKAPVPPAQLPFIRISGIFPSSKKIILLSSPPISMNVRTSECFRLIYSAAAMTSCAKRIPNCLV